MSLGSDSLGCDRPVTSATTKLAPIGSARARSGADATARVRLFLQQQGDTLTAREPNKRWWSTAYVELKEGDFTLNVPVSPDQWSSVFGRRGDEVPHEFNSAISQLANVGFTFGGTFAGHGVFVAGGNARFILKQYSVSHER
jgi:hypothetical protein